MTDPSHSRDSQPALLKTPTGIDGLDQITCGGFPAGRTTLVCGGAGAGKSIFALQFLVRGAQSFGEPGLLVSFEETATEIARNVAPLGFDLDDLVGRKLLDIDHVHIDRSQLAEVGGYDLSGLFARMGHAIDAIGAKRVVLDTLEALFASFTDEATLRAELQRLFRWLKEREVTAIVTAERGDGRFSRKGLEEYVSDCVILLDHRIEAQASTRRLRVVKYRGSSHGTNEYPFIIDASGIAVLPITALKLDYPVLTDRVSTGVPAMDEMLAGQGFYRGTSVLVTGGAGTGKSSLAAHFADATCARGERCLYFALEEPSEQIVRNMRSIGIDLAQWVDQGLLRLQAARPTVQSLEMHLVTIHKMVASFSPRAVVVDPISSLMAAGDAFEVKSMVVRLFDYLKMRGITSFVSCLTQPGHGEQTDIGLSSLMDTWVEVRDTEYSGERNRVMFVMKSRGMPHSKQVREFVITSSGIDLVPVYVGAGGVLTGSARVAQEAAEAAAILAEKQDVARKERLLAQRRDAVSAQVKALLAGLAAEEADLGAELEVQRARERRHAEERGEMERRRLGNPAGSSPPEDLKSARRDARDAGTGA